MKNVSLSLFLLLALFVAACGSSSSPDSVAVSYVEKLAAGDEGVLELMSKSTRSKENDEMAKVVLGAIKEEISKKGGLSSVKVIESKEEGETANVRLSTKLGDGTEDEMNIRLIKEDGTWKINELR